MRTIKTTMGMTLARKLTQALAREVGSPGDLRMASAFWAEFVHSFFDSVHQSYLRRSEGGRDETGHVWKPLADSTISRKRRLSARHRPKGGQAASVSRLGSRAWQYTYARTFARLASYAGTEAARFEASRMAWGAGMTALGGKPEIHPMTGREVPIMIDSGRLIRSYSPGKIVGGRYFPPKDQVFLRHEETIELGTEVEYAGYAESVRPVLHAGRGRWIQRALDTAIRKLSTELRLKTIKALLTS